MGPGPRDASDNSGDDRSVGRDPSGRRSAGGPRAVANSMVSLPRLRPTSTLTRVSRRSPSRSRRRVRPRAAAASRLRRGACGGAASRPAIATASSVERTDIPSAMTRCAISSIASGVARPSSARACPADRTPAATLVCTADGQAEQPDGVGDLRAGPADPAGQLLLRGAEVGEQLLVGGRLLERVELRAVQVLQQRVAQHPVVGGVAHDRRDGREADPLRRAPAALAHDQLVARRRRGGAPRSAAAARPRGCCRSAPPAPPRRRRCAAAPRSGVIDVDRQLGEPGALDLRQRPGVPGVAARSLRDQRAEPAAEPAALGLRHGCAPSGRRRCRTARRRSRARRRRRPALRASRGRRSRRTGRTQGPRRPGPTAGSASTAPMSPKCARTSCATWSASRVRESYIVSRIVDTASARVEVRLHHVDRAQQLAEPLERVVLALDRDQHLAASRPSR